MKKGDEWKKVLGLILILAIFVSVSGGAVSAEDISKDSTINVADTQLFDKKNNVPFRTPTDNTTIILGQIREEIEEKGAKWTAGKTSVSGLSMEAKKQLCGVKTGALPVEDVVVLNPPKVSYGTFDWRNVNGQNWVTSVKSQGLCGSCWIFGSTAAFETQINIDAEDPALDFDASEQHILSCLSQGWGCDGGWPGDCLVYIRDSGVPDEACFPYQADDTVPCNDACSDWPDRAYTCDIGLPEEHTTEIYKAILQHCGPMVVLLNVAEDFLYYTGGIYEPVWTSREFGWADHCVMLVGYDDPNGCWIVKNSWGPDWGEDGYGKVYYGNLEKYEMAWFVLNTSGLCGNMGVNSTSWSPTLNCGESDSQLVTVSASDGIVNGVTVSKISGPTWLNVSQTDLGDIASGSSKTFTMTASPPSETRGDFPYSVTVSNTCGTPSTRDVSGTIHLDCPESSWTFMVYLDGDNNLEGAGIDDFMEMSSVGSTSNVNIVVQFDRIPGYDSSYGDWRDCKRFHVTSGMTPTAENAISDLGECNMGDPNTLDAFVTWTMTNFPADNYALILWNHGNGWKSINKWVPWADDIKDAKDAGLTRGICWDNTNNDYLSLQETEVALTGKYVQLLGYDACLMHMIEVVYQVMANAGISVGSEESEPWDGWPYDTILSDLAVTPTMNEDALGTVIVDRYMDSYGYTGSETQSAMDNSDFSGLVTAVDNLAQALVTEINAGRVAEVQQARNAAEEIYYTYYIDLYHFAEMIQTYVPGAAAEAQAVMNEVSGSMYEAHGTSVPNDHGLSIYFPEAEWAYLSSYENTKFAVDTHWDEFLKEYYAPSKPDLRITEKWLCWPDNCTICYNVTNTGDGPAPACHNTALYVDGVAVAQDHVPVDLAPGESYTGCFNGFVWTYTPPSDDITVCADNNESIVELDEDNNCLTNIWMCGDVNCDGEVTMSDVVKVFNRYLDPDYPLALPWAADVNCDGEVTMSDVRKVFNRYLDPSYGLNCCCEV